LLLCLRKSGDESPHSKAPEPFEMELTDESILLRPYVEADAEHLYAAVRESIPEVSRWLAWCHENYSIDESRNFITARQLASQGDEWYSFAVFEKSSEVFIGGVGINFVNRVHQFANLGYWVRTSAAGRGFATRATRLAARFGFERLGLRRIEIVAAIDNLASQRVAEKAGAIRESVARKRLLIHGESHDAVIYSLIPEDFGLPTGL
jgi:RimJ/RimL family protein N-acetyltransferase